MISPGLKKPQRLRGLKKALYIVSNDFCGKECLSFFIADISLFIFGITLSICCLKLRYIGIFDRTFFQPVYC